MGRPSVLWALVACGALVIGGCVVLEPLATPGPSVITSPLSVADASASPTSMQRPTPTPAGSRGPGSSDRPTDGPIDQPSDQPTPRPTISTEGACGDDAYELAGYRWFKPYVWSFVESSVPSDLDANLALEVIKRSVENITTARNDCGLPDLVAAYSTYEGLTEEVPCDTAGTFGLNSIGFGEMPEDVEDTSIAVMCPFFDTLTDEFIEADILINKDVDWALSEDECFFEELLEATVTHEVGHAMGLSHVSERRHGDLTMSPESNGACATEEITLGLGDILGLQELYPIGD